MYTVCLRFAYPIRPSAQNALLMTCLKQRPLMAGNWHLRFLKSEDTRPSVETIMSEITGAIDLSTVPEDEFDPDLDLRVAVVREGAVLGSTMVKAGGHREPVRFAVQFEAPLLPGARLPCPVRLLVGPDVDDMELMGIDTLSRVVDLAGERADSDSGGDTAQGMQATANASYEAKVDVGILVVDVSTYNCWLYCCRTYTLRGRVVCRRWQYNPATGQWSFCDAPVPGATVEAYDVDRFFFWYHRDLIKSAVTDVNGNFVIRFRWCCLRWRPWLLQSWALETVAGT
eukprot:gene35860-44220_t